MSKSSRFLSKYGIGQNLSFIDDIRSKEYVNVFHKVYKTVKPSEVHKILDNLVQFVKELKKLDVDLHPREFYAREQAMLFAQDLYVKLKIAEFSGGRFRDGIENLYYLARKLAPIDTDAAKLLEDLMIRIIRITETIVNEGEKNNGLRETDWKAVVTLLEQHGKERKSLGKPVVGKIGHLQLDKILGAGGFGVVYKAWLGNSVCTLKLVPAAQMPSAKHAIMDKMVASVINHPCLVKYYATFAAEGAFVTIMEYIRGVDLSKLLRVVGYFPMIVLKVVIAQLGVAIQHLHFCGFIHRDIKPENMMILPGCRIKLIDFDTAKACIGKFHSKIMPSYYQRTKLEFLQPEVAGTYPYTPPECLTSKGYGRTIDWWALGVVSYQLATGQLPFSPENQDILHSQITSASFTWPAGREFEPELKYLVNACLRINPKFRLCSRHYSEFQKHPFFEGTDWLAIETAPVLIHYDPIHEVYAHELSFKSNLQYELLTPTVALADLKARPKEAAAAVRAQSDPAKKTSNDDISAAASDKSGKTSPAKSKPSKTSSKKDKSSRNSDKSSKKTAEAKEESSKKSEPAETPAKKEPAVPAQAVEAHAHAAAVPHAYNLLGQISPSSSPSTEFKKQRLFGDLTQINDLDDQVNIYTYSSWPFSRAMEAIDRGEMPDSNALHEEPDRVVTEDDKQHPYAFEEYLKK